MCLFWRLDISSNPRSIARPMWRMGILFLDRNHHDDWWITPVSFNDNINQTVIFSKNTSKHLKGVASVGDATCFPNPWVVKQKRKRRRSQRRRRRRRRRRRSHSSFYSVLRETAAEKQVRHHREWFALAQDLWYPAMYKYKVFDSNFEWGFKIQIILRKNRMTNISLFSQSLSKVWTESIPK